MRTHIANDSAILISVIVPVYNREKYLDRCIQSLLNQTYRNIEIILVDDGSSDSSPELCDGYAKSETRIKVIHKTNGGISSARNAGIINAKGNYITFIDSDDWIALDTYEYCIKLLEKYKADIVQFNYYMVRGQETIKQPRERIHIYRDKEILQYYMESSTKTGSYSVCRCLFPTEIIKKLRFREGKINEDIDFKYKALKQCKVLVNSNQYKYYYFQSGESLSTGGLKRKDLDLYEAANELRKLTNEENFGSIRFLGNAKAARTSFSLLSKIAYFGIADYELNNEKFIEELLQDHRKQLRVILLAPLPFSRKVLALAYVVNFKLSCKLISFLKMKGLL